MLSLLYTSFQFNNDISFHACMPGMDMIIAKMEWNFLWFCHDEKDRMIANAKYNIG